MFKMYGDKTGYMGSFKRREGTRGGHASKGQKPSKHLKTRTPRVYSVSTGVGLPCGGARETSDSTSLDPMASCLKLWVIPLLTQGYSAENDHTRI